MLDILDFVRNARFARPPPGPPAARRSPVTPAERQSAISEIPAPGSPENPGQSSLQIFRKKDLHRIVHGRDPGDVAFVIDHEQGEEVVFGDGVGPILCQIGRVCEPVFSPQLLHKRLPVQRFRDPV